MANDNLEADGESIHNLFFAVKRLAMMAGGAGFQFVFCTIILNGIGWGIIFPVLPTLLGQFSSDPSVIAKNQGYFMAIFSLMTFLSGSAMGKLSDRFGRRPILLISLFGSVIDHIAMAFAPNLYVLFATRAVAGILAADYAVAAAFVADTSDERLRARRFGLLGAAGAIGAIFGPVVGGIFGGPEAPLGPRTPFLIFAIAMMINMVFGFLFMPESLPLEKRRKVSILELNPFPIISRAFRNKKLQLLLVIFVLTEFFRTVNLATWSLYTESKFHWGPAQIGWSFAFSGICLAIVNGWFASRVIGFLGAKKTTIGAAMVASISLISFGLAPSGWIMTLLLAFFAWSYLATPALQLEFARISSATDHGEIQGVLYSLRSMTLIVGPLCFTSLFSASLPSNHLGATYFFAALVALVTVGLSIQMKPTNSSGEMAHAR